MSSYFYLVLGSPWTQVLQEWLVPLPILRRSQRTIHSLLCSYMPAEQEAQRSLRIRPFKGWMKVILTIKTAFLTRWVKHSLIFDAMKSTWISAFYSLKCLHLIGWVLKTECEKGKSGLHLPLDEATCLSPRGSTSFTPWRFGRCCCRGKGFWAGLEAVWQGRDLGKDDILTQWPLLPKQQTRMPTGINQFMTQKNASHENFEEWESTGPVLRGDHNVSLAHRCRVEHRSIITRPSGFLREASDSDFRNLVSFKCWQQSTLKVFCAYDAWLGASLKASGSYGMGMCLLPKKLPRGKRCNRFGIVTEPTRALWLSHVNCEP